MRISDFLSTDSIFTLNLNNKEELFKEISKIFSEKAEETTKEEIFDLIKKREDLDSTYAGKKTAIPHIKYGKIKKFYIFLFLLENEISYHEDKRVKNVFFIAGPDKNYSLHLMILSRIARMLKETDISEKIMDERNKERILNFIREAEKRII